MLIGADVKLGGEDGSVCYNLSALRRSVLLPLLRIHGILQELMALNLFAFPLKIFARH